MKQDERGYVLILVLVTMAALAVLSLAAIQVNLATNKQTVIRVDETQLDADVKGTLNLLVADLKRSYSMDEETDVPDYMKSELAFQDKIHSLLVTNKQYSGSQLSGDNDIVYSIERSDSDRIDAPFTTVLTLTATGTTIPKAEQPTQTATYTQEVYLTALPSFLYYVLGSDQQLTINGPPKITGNIFVGNDTAPSNRLTVQRTATYQLGSTEKTLENSSSSRFYLNGKIDLATGTSCDGCDQENYFTDSSTPSAGERPKFGENESSFSPFNFDYSIIQYINRFRTAETDELVYTMPPAQAIFDRDVSNIDPVSPVPYLNQPNLGWTEYIDSAQVNDIDSLQIIASPVSSPSMISESIAPSEIPLLFDGDVIIEAAQPITISRPLIVNGNLTIRGNVAFNTTVYALKDAFIDRATITGVSQSQNSSLVLLAKGKVLLNRINEFEDTTTPLQAFLYSDAEATSKLYAVGSIIHIKGGFYSRGPLEINTFRGTFRPLPAQSAKEAHFAPGNRTQTDDIDKSRLIMTYNEGVFEQIQTLPVSNQLQLFTARPVKQ